ncbi:glucoamylase [Pilimelia anulata]|uniref:Glucoamylase n=1 Tax=Pilimelia anulata TaxID=53371 RepID=A0A8J3B669_9ACTN|nr:glycoside hydrolase family 15 protein [Pilimelia anulata]GGJ87153.1 glucoamylase [Pilimelia anulata]
MPGLIEDYAVIGDLQTAALVGRDGAIDWLCLPHFDSPACFAALLDDDRAGTWRIAPAGGGPATRRRYREDTLILESEWDTAGGRVRVTDLMPPRGRAADLVRIVEGLAGRVPMRMDLRLRFDYGRVVPWVRHPDDLVAVAGPDAVWLRTDAPLRGEDLTTVSEFAVAAGERVAFVLTHRPSHEPRPEPVDWRTAVADTERYWHEWIAGCRYEGRWAPAVRRALITLKALTFAPTGGIVAAATTSLPEEPGGSRNWDYRYCWLRDSTFTLQALLETGFAEEAAAWREWLLRAAAGDPADLQIMYGLDGTRRIPEYTLDGLAGHAGSRPVRIGNAAADQLQLDVWGEVLSSLHLARHAGAEPGADADWDLQRALLDFLEGNWRRADNSLWEVRGPRRHFVHSKVLAWAGFDCAVAAVRRHGLPGPADRWAAIRDEIHAEVCRRGYDPARNTFTQYYGSAGLDAALLLLPRVGFLPWSDPRMVGTVEAIQRELCDEGLVRRYRPEHPEHVDGLPGGEGAFLACTFWLVDALHGAGRTAEAEKLFARLLDLRNDVGLLSEEVDPATGRHLGNTPQAFSLVGIINSARRLSGAQPAGFGAGGGG